MVIGFRLDLPNLYPCPELESPSVETGATCCLSSSSPLDDVPGWFEMTQAFGGGTVGDELGSAFVLVS